MLVFGEDSDKELAVKAVIINLFAQYLETIIRKIAE